MVALLVATSATLSGCAGHSDRAAGSSQVVAAGAKQIQTEYVPCGKPPVKLEKIDQDFLDSLAAAAPAVRAVVQGRPGSAEQAAGRSRGHAARADQ